MAIAFAHGLSSRKEKQAFGIRFLIFKPDEAESAPFAAGWSSKTGTFPGEITKTAVQSCAATKAVNSTKRLAYPHSLSYHAITFTM